MNAPGKQVTHTLSPVLLTRKSKNHLIQFLFALPALIFFLAFVYYPVADLFRISFSDWNTVRTTVNYVGLKNYRWLFFGSGADKVFASLRVTFLFTLGELSCCLIGGMLLALLFNRMTKGFNLMRGLMVLPKYIATSSSAVIFVWMMNPRQGILTYVMNLLFGLGEIKWLNSMPLALISLIFFSAWRGIGYAMIIYLSAMRGIPVDYYEAAQLDGANAFKRFRHITIPMLSPTILFLGVTSFLNSMKVYQSVDVLTEGGPYDATNVIVYWIYEIAFREFRMDRAATVGCMFFVILMAITILTMKWSNKRVNYDV